MVLPVLTLTTPNHFMIGPPMTDIRGVSKLPLAMNHPAYVVSVSRRIQSEAVRPRIFMSRRNRDHL